MTTNSIRTATVVLFVGTVLVFDMLRAGAPPADEPAAAQYVVLNLGGACDEENRRLYLANLHEYRTIVTTVRWRAAGGKELTEQFFPPPASESEIGCAASAEILEATFADF